MTASQLFRFNSVHRHTCGKLSVAAKVAFVMCNVVPHGDRQTSGEVTAHDISDEVFSSVERAASAAWLQVLFETSELYLLRRNVANVAN